MHTHMAVAVQDLPCTRGSLLRAPKLGGRHSGSSGSFQTVCVGGGQGARSLPDLLCCLPGAQLTCFGRDGPILCLHLIGQTDGVPLCPLTLGIGLKRKEPQTGNEVLPPKHERLPSHCPLPRPRGGCGEVSCCRRVGAQKASTVDLEGRVDCSQISTAWPMRALQASPLPSCPSGV